jgi:hypothetical protein
VDGTYVRRRWDRDFIGGGHWLRFKFMPQNEIWIEQIYTPNDIKLFIIHEVSEVLTMLLKNASYDEAHRVAVICESYVDNHPDYFETALSRMFKKLGAQSPKTMVKEIESQLSDLVEGIDPDQIRSVCMYGRERNPDCQEIIKQNKVNPPLISHGICANCMKKFHSECRSIKILTSLLNEGP